MRVAVIVNPTSGRGKPARLLPQLESALRSAGVEFDVHTSRSPEEPERLARTAAEEGAGVVVAFGGDGMVGMVANGVIGTNAALGIIPGGTGNDFATLLGLNAKDPVSNAKLLANPTIRRIDAVRVTTPQTSRYYVNVGGAGFDSEVNAYANEMKVLKGKPKYIAATFILLPRFKAGRFVLTLDGEQRQLPGMLVAVGNGVSYGGGMKVVPSAQVDDGVLDVCVIGEVGKFDFVKTFPKVFKGRHVDHPKVTMLRAKEVRIEAERTLQVFADGEHMGTLPATFEVQPGILRVVAPADGGSR